MKGQKVNSDVVNECHQRDSKFFRLRLKVLDVILLLRTSIKQDIQPSAQERHILVLLEAAITRWSPYTRGLSLVGRARADNSLVFSSVVHHIHGYLPTDRTIHKIQARLARFIWGPERTAWFPGSVLARPVSLGGFSLIDIETQLRLSCFKGVQAALRGNRNAYSWLVESDAWLYSGSWLSPRRLRLHKIWEAVADIFTLDHSVLTPHQLLNLPIIGGCRLLRPPDLLAPTRGRLPKFEQRKRSSSVSHHLIQQELQRESIKMPGHRKWRQFKQTDAFTRGMVIGLKRAGWSIRQIAADTHLGASTVHRLWRRLLEQGNVAIYRNAGATRVTSARVDRRILRQAVAAPQATCIAILQHVQDTLDHSISTRTISRRLVANGLHSFRPLRRLPLTPPNRRQRLEWCRARSTWMTEWHRVVFSDESRFCLSSDSRRVRVWRRRRERSNPAAIVERPTVRQRGIMVWGAIAYDSRSPSYSGHYDGQRYVDDVLRPVTLPYLQGVPNALYQQDNARPHTARISQQALQDVQMLPWPPYSPDLSSIEHVWDIIGRRLHALPQPRSEDELWQMVEREWRAIPQDAIRTLIGALPRRVAACIAFRVQADRRFYEGHGVGLKRAGWSIRQIAADTHLGASTVHRLWRRWLEQGNVAIYRKVGATRVTSARVDRRILRQAVAALQATCTAILQHVQDTLDHSISTRTISRRLVANGLHSCRPLRRLPLTPPNRRQRLEWCRARSTWMTEWHRVVFSDESRFCLSSDSRRVRVWRRRGERSNPAAIVERPTVRQRGIMVWGAIAYDSRSTLLRIQGTMTAQRYVDDVLRPVTLPYLQGVPNALYQQDNARPHTARISQQALQDVQMLPWPPYSPDLSPIEHVWDIIGRRLHALPQPRSEDELWQMVEREWRAIPKDAIHTLIDSLPRRVAACIAVR
ncbi:hypothetical protein LAZ67_9000945, partial [Cordylochernes scorpioides]